MKRILKSKLDKFYTKVDVAIECINQIDLNKYDLFIDPCCGGGAFYSNIEGNKIGIDLEPSIDNVIKHDFLTWDYSNINIDRSKVLVISNPPFGKQGSLAMLFVKRAIEFSDTIAFILPLSFSKQSVKNRMPPYYHLVSENILPENSFLLDDEDYLVKCVFQIWERRDTTRNYIENEKEVGFKYNKEITDCDISVRRVGVYAGKASLDLSKSKQSHYFIEFEDKINIDNFIDEINKIKWNDLTVGPRSISKGELTPIINNIIKKSVK